MNATTQPCADFQTRYANAKRWRDNSRTDLKEILSFICPGRENDFDVNTTIPKNNDGEQDETLISLPEDLATDFAADLVTYFTPAEAMWTEYLVTMPIPQDQAAAVKQIVDTREEDLFDLITSSNYNDVAPQVMFEANHGTVAMWVEKSHLTQPIYVETVPPTELLITPGHNGILDRFREKWVMASTLKALFDGWDVSLDDHNLKSKMGKPSQTVKVCWGFWLDWEDPGNPMWRCEVVVDGLRITPPTPLTLGPYAGSCPLLVGRFNPQVNKPWGRGPAWKALPDMRVYNAVDEGVLEAMDQALRNTLIYADDGFIDMANGVMPGGAYPAGRGFTRDQVYELAKGTNLDAGWFSEERLEDRLRARFYQDGPRQRGDTPPTASQWIDERRRVQQRLGKPSAPLWREFFLPFIQRVEQLGVEAGKIDGVLTHNGDQISVLPVSPLQKAQNQDKVMTTRANLELGAGVLGETFPQVVNGIETFRKIVEVSGDELTVINEEQEQVPNATPAPQV